MEEIDKINIKWNSDAYTKNFDFVHKQSEGLIELIDVEKGAFIVDLGCGNDASLWQFNASF